MSEYCTTCGDVEAAHEAVDCILALTRQRDEARTVARDLLEAGVCIAGMERMHATERVARYPWLRHAEEER